MNDSNLDFDGLIPLGRVLFSDPIKPATVLGVPGKLEWIPVNQLYIDHRYQRPMNEAGRKNVRRIVEGGSWALFSPLIVAPRGAGRYAVIDGQHRASGAITHGGVREVPCLIIYGGRAVEARAFAIINGQVTSVLPVHIFHARLLAGEPEAVAIDACCMSAGVEVIRRGYHGRAFMNASPLPRLAASS